MSRPSIGIVTVTYNASALLPQTMNSVLSQISLPEEYILIDGGSTDGTVEIIRSRSTDISLWISERDAGLYDAMNKGVTNAKSDWILFMNAGDTLASIDVLERIRAFLVDGNDVVYGDCLLHRPGKRTIYNHALPVKLAFRRMIASHQSLLVRRELLIKNPFDLRFKIAADFHLVAKLHKAKSRFCKVEFPIGEVVVETYTLTEILIGLREKRLIAWEVSRSPSVWLYHALRVLEQVAKNPIKILVRWTRGA